MLNAIFDHHYIGLRHWMLQRATALLMLGYTLLLAARAVGAAPLSYPAWRALFSPLWFKCASLLLVVSLLLHAWLGVKDILSDYVRPPGLRQALQRLLLVALFANLAWSILILWSA